MNKISINNFSDVEIEILRKLNEYGKGYIVGGAIRDILLGLEPKDIDFTTNLPYETLKDLFNKYNPKETGKSFGVLRIRVNDIDYEIAKFREDNYEEKDGLKIIPEEKKVSFVDDIKNDLARRTAQQLKAGHITSCGCKINAKNVNYKNLSGLRFGRLTALYPTLERDKKY